MMGWREEGRALELVVTPTEPSPDEAADTASAVASPPPPVPLSAVQSAETVVASRIVDEGTQQQQHSSNTSAARPHSLLTLLLLPSHTRTGEGGSHPTDIEMYPITSGPEVKVHSVPLKGVKGTLLKGAYKIIQDHSYLDWGLTSDYDEKTDATKQTSAFAAAAAAPIPPAVAPRGAKQLRGKNSSISMRSLTRRSA